MYVVTGESSLDAFPSPKLHCELISLSIFVFPNETVRGAVPFAGSAVMISSGDIPDPRTEMRSFFSTLSFPPGPPALRRTV